MQGENDRERVDRAMALDVDDCLIAQAEEYKRIHGHYKTEEEALDEVFENARLMGTEVDEFLPELQPLYQKWIDAHPDVVPE